MGIPAFWASGKQIKVAETGTELNELEESGFFRVNMADEFLQKALQKARIFVDKIWSRVVSTEQKCTQVDMADAVLATAVSGITFPFSGASNGNFRENTCSEGDLRSRIFGAFVVTFLARLPLLGFSNIYKMV